MCAVINIENIDLVGRDHEEDMNDCLLTCKLDPSSWRYPTSSPVLQMGLSSSARPMPLLLYWLLSLLTYWRTSLQQHRIVAN